MSKVKADGKQGSWGETVSDQGRFFRTPHAAVSGERPVRVR